MKPLQIAYILPVHNDEKTIHICFERLNKNLKNEKNLFVVMVENGSKDDSLRKTKELANQNKNFPVHVFSEKQAGLGFALHRGITEALKIWDRSTDLWLIITASDLPFGFSPFDHFMSWYKKHLGNVPTGLAMGSKAHPESVIVNPISRRAMTFAYQMARRIFLGMKTRDSQGDILIRASLAEKLLPKIESRNFFFGTELVYFAERAGEKVEELPVEVTGEIRPSTVRPLKDGSRMFMQIFELRARESKR